MRSFSLQQQKPDDKELIIWGPAGLRMTVDFDDVNHREIQEVVERMLSMLNDLWRQPNVYPVSPDEVRLPAALRML